MIVKNREKNGRGDETFSGSRGFFWTILIVGALILGPTVLIVLSDDDISPKATWITLGFAMFYALTVYGLYNPRKHRWALRIVCFCVFVSFLVFLIYMIAGFATGEHAALNEGDVKALIGSIIAFLSFGVPSLIYALTKGKVSPDVKRTIVHGDSDKKDLTETGVSYEGALSYEEYSRVYDLVRKRGVSRISTTTKLIVLVLLILIYIILFVSMAPKAALIMAIVLTAMAGLFVGFAGLASRKHNKKKYEQLLEMETIPAGGEVCERFIRIPFREMSVTIPLEKVDGYIETDSVIAVVDGNNFWGFNASMFQSEIDWERAVSTLRSRLRKLPVS